MGSMLMLMLRIVEGGGTVVVVDTTSTAINVTNATSNTNETFNHRMKLALIDRVELSSL